VRLGALTLGALTACVPGVLTLGAVTACVPRGSRVALFLPRPLRSWRCPVQVRPPRLVLSFKFVRLVPLASLGVSFRSFDMVRVVSIPAVALASPRLPPIPAALQHALLATPERSLLRVRQRVQWPRALRAMWIGLAAGAARGPPTGVFGPRPGITWGRLLRVSTPARAVSKARAV
jgi:hypothetical protein